MLLETAASWFGDVRIESTLKSEYTSTSGMLVQHSAQCQWCGLVTSGAVTAYYWNQGDRNHCIDAAFWGVVLCSFVEYTWPCQNSILRSACVARWMNALLSFMQTTTKHTCAIEFDINVVLQYCAHANLCCHNHTHVYQWYVHVGSNQHDGHLDIASKQDFCNERNA